MATNQNYGQQQQPGSLFNPGIFDDPDALAMAALAENQPTPTPSPDAMAAAPVSGVVPKSFTEYAADPLNVAKIPAPVPPNTPLPSVVAKTVTSAMAQPSDLPAPVDSSIEGDPARTPQLLPRYANIGDTNLSSAALSTPTLEDSLMSGPPNGGKGLTAAASEPAASATPAGPLSKQDFLAQHPVKLPGQPYVPQGKKLALTGLFAALDNAGAFLDHGSPSVGPGLMHNVQALQEYNQNLPVAQQQAEQAAYDEYLKNYGAVRSNTLSPVTTIGPDGRTITTYVDPKTQSNLLGAGVKAGSSLINTQIKAESAEDVARLRLAFQQGKVARVIPVKMQDGSAGMAAYDAQGNLLHTIPGALPPAQYLPTNSTTQDIKEDGNGGYIIIPKTETKAPNLGGVGNTGTVPAAGGRAPMSPPGSRQSAAAPGAQGGTATNQSRRTGQPPVASGPVARPVLNAAGQQQGGKNSTAEGYVFDPQVGRQVQTTREEAATKYPGQVFDPVKHTDIVADRNIITNLQDVGTKLGNYEKAIANPKITDEDRANMAYILKDDKFKAGLFGVEIPVDQFNQMLSAYHVDKLSKPAQDALIAYYNARESLPGYNYLVTHSGRSNKESLKLALDAIPNPVMSPDYIQNGLNQFRQNLQIKGRGLPIIKGLNDGPDGNPASANPPAQQKKTGINFVPDHS